MKITENEPCKVAPTGWGSRRSVGEWAFHNPSASNPSNETVRAERSYLRYRATNPH